MESEWEQAITQMKDELASYIGKTVCLIGVHVVGSEDLTQRVKLPDGTRLKATEVRDLSGDIAQTPGLACAVLNQPETPHQVVVVSHKIITQDTQEIVE